MEISRKIVGYSVVKQPEPDNQDDAKEGDASDVNDAVQMNESLERPEIISGTTYKLKPPEHVSEHALYVTINDVILNPGTVNETRRPFEIFINSKSLEHYQWIVALTLVMSAVFRKGGDVNFLVEELTSVFDPRGGYWNKGKFVPSMIAEIGEIVKTHFISLGMMEVAKLDENQKRLIDEKREQYDALNGKDDSSDTSSGYPAKATLCSKCNEKAVVVLDNCGCCLSCGYSKC